MSISTMSTKTVKTKEGASVTITTEHPILFSCCGPLSANLLVMASVPTVSPEAACSEEGTSVALDTEHPVIFPRCDRFRADPLLVAAIRLDETRMTGIVHATILKLLILLVIKMTTGLTVAASNCAPHASKKILLHGDGLKMGEFRSDTKPDPANVVEAKTIGNWPLGEYPGNSVRTSAAVKSIPGRTDPSGPQPMRIRLVDAGPELLLVEHHPTSITLAGDNIHLAL